MLLAIDVGNTNTVIGLAPLTDGPIRATWRFASQHDRTEDEWYALLRLLLADASVRSNEVGGVAIASVVPPISAAITRLAQRHLGVQPLIVAAGLELGIRVRTDNPLETGADRIVNCAAAYAQFGGPANVVDLGTATKIEAITKEGEFLGGAIAPGLGIAMDALATRTARLRSVDLVAPTSAIGRNTVAAIQAGVVGGHLAMVEGMVRRIADELGGADAVILTGGYCHVLAPRPSFFTAVRPDLSLEGLRIAYRLNRQ
jgi:type III pantothenate kinase